MGEIIYKFDTNNPDDRHDIELHHKAEDMWLSLWGFSQYLRGELKDNSSKLNYKSLEKINDKFYEILDDYLVNLNEL
jgi:hypothetical protein